MGVEILLRYTSIFHDPVSVQVFFEEETACTCAKSTGPRGFYPLKRYETRSRESALRKRPAEPESFSLWLAGCTDASCCSASQ